MEQPEIPNQEVVTQIQQMLDTPIEDQAAKFELALLGGVLQNTLELLSNAESNQEASEILRSMIKSAFVIGRRHFNQLFKPVLTVAALLKLRRQDGFFRRGNDHAYVLETL